jgi:dTDP-4-dehydrorhamnose reductase
MKQLVLITGASGQLGGAMAEQLGSRHEVVAATRRDLDVTSAAAVSSFVAGVCPDVIVNCAAYTDVDGAEANAVDALAANAWAVRSLARAAGEIDATLVHFSTDFVFDGETDHPYSEDDAPNPRSVYAMSKLLGEWFAVDAPRHYVLRVESLFGGPRAKSSVDRLLEQLRGGQPARAFADRTVSPSYVDDVVAATAALVQRRAPSGVYHCVNSGWATWADLARELARLEGAAEAAVTEVSVKDVALAASRPTFAALSNAKLGALGIVMPSWQEALRRYVESTRGSAAVG